MSAARFARACVASPDRTASEAGAAMLAAGGNAMDAALCVNLVLGVVAPDRCGFGGDLFALVWDGGAHGYLGAGRAGATASVTGARVPERGPQAVTVPGAVAGWFDLAERFASMPFARLAEPALALARDGFAVSDDLAAGIAASRGDGEWERIYGNLRAGTTARLPELARLIELLIARGADGYYRGPVAEAIAAASSFLTAGDLAAHTGEWVEPLRARFAGREVLELPPPTQGVTALQMLRMADRLDLDGAARDHLLVEVAKLALADRDEHLGEPATMRVDPASLLADEHVARAVARIDPDRARPMRAAAVPDGGTAYLCAADARGMMVSLIQSNFAGFGSGVTVPGWGINLHNRGASFVARSGHPNALAPGKRPLHTLIPAVVLRDGEPEMVVGSMGGHGQAQIHLQMLVRMLRDDADIQEAIDAPRWIVSHTDGSVVGEADLGPAWFDELRARGHRVIEAPPRAALAGHAHAIARAGDGYAGATDPRVGGAVLGH